jgi:hypothetical protein
MLVAIVVTVATPWFKQRRSATARADCIDTLRQIDGAKQQWALENHASSNAVPTWKDLLPYGGRGRDYDPTFDWNVHFPPRCPAGGTYTIERVADAPTCSFPGHVLQ